MSQSMSQCPVFSFCVRSLHPAVSEQHIRTAFQYYNIGTIHSIDFIEKDTEIVNAVGAKIGKFRSAYIHLQDWSDLLKTDRAKYDKFIADVKNGYKLNLPAYNWNCQIEPTGLYIVLRVNYRPNARQKWTPCERERLHETIRALQNQNRGLEERLRWAEAALHAYTQPCCPPPQDAQSDSSDYVKLESDHPDFD